MKVIGINRAKLTGEIEELLKKRDAAELANGIIEMYLAKPNWSLKENLKQIPHEEEIFEYFKNYEWFKEENYNLIRAVCLICIFGAVESMVLNSAACEKIEESGEKIGNSHLAAQVKNFAIRIMPAITIYDSDFYEKNSYTAILKSLKTDESKMHIEFMPTSRRMLSDTDVVQDDNCIDFIYSLGFLNGEFEYPIMVQDNCIYKFFDLNDINNSEKVIDQAKGNILCIGSRFGYFEYLASQKEEVESVDTVIMKDPELFTEFFNDTLYPAFPNGNKIHVVSGDLKDVIKKKNYDMVFVQNRLSMNDFFNIRGLEMQTNKKFIYMMKNSICEKIKSIICIIIGEEAGIYHVMPFEEVDIGKKIISSYLNNVTIKNTDDIKKLLSKQSIDEMFFH